MTGASSVKKPAAQMATTPTFLFIIAGIFFFCSVNCQDFSYFADNAYVPFTYEIDSSDQPWGKPPLAHKRDHLIQAVGVERAFRYNTSDPKCNRTVDCSIPILNPNPKVVAQTVGSIMPKNTKHPRAVNIMHLGIGQIANHDVARYNGGQTGWDMEWPFPANDPLLVFNQTGAAQEISQKTNFTLTFKLKRLLNYPNTGPNTGNPWNSATSAPIWFALNPIYGTNQNLADSRRNKTTGDMILDDFQMMASPNNQILLSPAIMTLFIKEHNWYAKELRTRYPNMNATAIYRYAKRWTVAVWQNIAFYEYAPTIFSEPMPPYDGFNRDPNFGVPIEVPIICHYPYSEFTSQWPLMDENWEEIYSVPAEGTFGNRAKAQDIFTKFGWESLFRGAMATVQENVDLYMVDALRLLAANGQSSSDLYTRVIARSRDQGTPTYNDIRQAYNFTRIKDWSELSPNILPLQIEALKSVYGSVDNLEFWIGGLAEWNNNTHMGPLWTKIYKNYWLSVRSNDKFWFEGEAAAFSLEEINQIKQIKLSTLINKHFPKISRLPCSAMFAHAPDCPPAASPPACNPQDDNSITLMDDFVLSWLNMTQGDNTVVFTLRAPTTGFIAMGFPATPGRMLGSNVFIGRVWDNNQTNVTVTPHYITARYPCTKGQGVCPTEGRFRVNVLKGKQQNGFTEIQFSVSPFYPGYNISIVASFGQRDELEYHGVNKAAGTINVLATGCCPLPSCAGPPPSILCPQCKPQPSCPTVILS